MLDDQKSNTGRQAKDDEFSYLDVPPPPNYEGTKRYRDEEGSSRDLSRESFPYERGYESLTPAPRDPEQHYLAPHHYPSHQSTPPRDNRSLIQLSINTLLVATLVATILHPGIHEKGAPTPNEGGETTGKVEKNKTNKPTPVPRLKHNIPQLISRLELLEDDELVELVGDGKLLRTELPYATAQNFTGVQQYNASRCFLAAGAAKALLKALSDAENQGYGIHLLDCYRPFQVQEKIYRHQQEQGGPDVASTRRDANGRPVKGSVHNKGAAVDITLTIDGKDVPMPTAFDAEGPGAHWRNISKETQGGKNAHRLLAIMNKAGFETVSTEWWHYEWKQGKNFPLIDRNFEDLIVESFKVEFK